MALAACDQYLWLAAGRLGVAAARSKPAPGWHFARRRNPSGYRRQLRATVTLLRQ
jgi:hypothetical protein